jgi:hypothetical protein
MVKHSCHCVLKVKLHQSSSTILIDDLKCSLPLHSHCVLHDGSVGSPPGPHKGMSDGVQVRHYQHTKMCRSLLHRQLERLVSTPAIRTQDFRGFPQLHLPQAVIVP